MTMAVVEAHDATSLRKPAYAVDSIDHALMTLDMLARRPQIRLTELAAELHIGRATAHRLLQMMLFRGFAVQNLDRSYAAGPALLARHQPNHSDEMQRLRTGMRPHLEAASATLQDTTHLKVLIGIEAVCLDSVEGSFPLHTPSSRGARYPAEYVSGGLLLLATLRAEELKRRFAGRPDESMAGLQRILVSTRLRGFGLIVDEGRAGISSVASLILDRDGQAVAAISCSAPRMRMAGTQTIATANVLRATAEAARAAMWPGAASVHSLRAR